MAKPNKNFESNCSHEYENLIQVFPEFGCKDRTIFLGSEEFLINYLSKFLSKYP